VAWIGAFRLGREHSVWAHLFYKEGRRAKARARFERIDGPFNKLKARVRRSDGESQSAAESG
jgi:hypothetical protein